jgi:hypothetical protein
MVATIMAQMAYEPVESINKGLTPTAAVERFLKKVKTDLTDFGLKKLKESGGDRLSKVRGLIL